MAFMAHETAIIDPGATIGEATSIWHSVHICAGARISERRSLGRNVFIGSSVAVRDNAKVRSNVSIHDDVTPEDDAFCGPSMVLTNVTIPARLWRWYARQDDAE